jgi:hypothetical protein
LKRIVIYFNYETPRPSITLPADPFRADHPLSGYPILFYASEYSRVQALREKHAMETKVMSAFNWLDTMPYDKHYPVTKEQAEVVKKWMRLQPEFDGGISFNADFTQIYKSEMPVVPEKWRGKKLE